ncbi:hypothetical protein BHM03_00005015 [Ensete ventricosum]|nr:hypothetical protein BHM03_00005015 [Ensete ventricosum]
MISIFRSFLRCFIRACRYVILCKEFLDSLAVEIYELKSKREDVERDVVKARRGGKQPRSQVLWWLDRVESLESKFAKIITEFERRLMLPGNLAPNVWSSYRLSSRADEMIAEVRYLKSKGSFDQVADQVFPDRFEEVPSSPTVGMDLVLEQLRRVLEDDAVGIVGIYGMGGVGKTALLSRFHNEFLADATHLDVVIFIDACRGLGVDRIQRMIGDRLGLSRKNRGSQEEKAATLFKVLNKMRFVLILDGVCRSLDLRMVGVPIPKRRSKCMIVLATRNEDLCDQMGAKKKIKVEALPWDAAWKLFTETAGEEMIDSHPGVRRQAEILVRKCGGLPLALIAVARALASKRSPEDYDLLPDDTLRSCALHFALYREGCRLHQNLLQECWFGEGILGDFEDVEEANNRARYLLGVLSAASLIDRVDANGYTRMHPVIRAMVLWIACECGEKENRWFVREREGLTDAPDAETWAGATRLALGDNEITVLPEAPHCPDLVSLKLKNNLGLEKIPDGFFGFMPSLAVLDLHSTSIKELPPGIGNLVGLQFLELCGTKLKSLPKELGALTKLKYLGLNWTVDLASIPDGLIRDLGQLRVLRMIVSYKSWKAGSSGDGVDMEELEALNRLRILDITVGTAAALERLAQSRRLAPATAALLIKGCRGLSSIELPSLLGKNMKRLKWLRASHSKELEDVVIGGGGLENLVLEHLLKAKIVWRGSHGQNLRGLYIYGCNGMEQLIYYHKGDEEAEDGKASGGVAIVPFPNLTEIALRGLPELKRVSEERKMLAFPSLESMEVAECPKLRKLTLVAEKLREIKCQRSWWDQLEWEEEDDATKSAFQLIMKPLQ